MTQNVNISGYILAGGRSSRMGTDKALLIFQEKPLLKHIISLIEPICDIVVISGQNFGYSNFGVEIVPDLYTQCGPIAGIYSSLEHSVSEWNLLVSVDVPFINEELLQYLISEAGDYDCVVPEHRLGVEPLIGMYRRRILPVVDEMITHGDYKITRLLSQVNTRYLDCNSLVDKYPRLFTNINRPEDYQLI
jgi:molybdopterin-guanine dinucleotide biosynthesis protein A